MPQLPNPQSTLRELLKVDHTTAIFLMATMTILAIVGAFAAFNIDAWTLLLYGLVSLILTFLFTVIAAIVASRATRQILGWIVLALALAWLFLTAAGGLFNPVTGLIASIFESRTPPVWLKGIECWVRPLENCTKVQDTIATSDAAPAIKPVDEAEAPATTPAAAVDKSKYTIYVQFAGYQRQTVIDAAKALQAAGWKVQGAAQGGQRLAAAAGLSQVRYSADADKAAAELLASDINQTGIKGGVAATQNPVIVPGVLEIWIGQ
ncbi:hypothetical protein [Rhizobium sp. SG2393]|uniref:hypothetical protein n=1 Tax=Rhizobium sp. SG2393 TaxID=3276279 RepID=UPI003671AB48